jgi:hypothetical protein
MHISSTLMSLDHVNRGNIKSGVVLGSLVAGPCRSSLHPKSSSSTLRTLLGDRETLKELVNGLTRIPTDILSGQQSMATSSVAIRMSWAANRKVEREEDLAYCLMGIFNVNMPLLYGEGDRTFIRLQEEIMKSSDDHSLFDWRDPHDRPGEGRGLLAHHPKFFEHSGDIVPYADWTKRAPFAMTNKGLQIELGVDENPGTAPLQRTWCSSILQYQNCQFWP